MNPILSIVIKLLIPTVFDLIIAALEELAKRTDSDIDDSVLTALKENKAAVIDAAKLVANNGK